MDRSAAPPAPSPHQPRQRRECLGELVQIDGSEYAWFEDRGPARTSSFSIILISTAGSVLSTGRLPANHPVSQPNPIAVVGGHGILGGSLRGSDLPGDLVGGLGGLVGEVLHLARHHRETLARLAGACGLDRGVQRQQVGLPLPENMVVGRSFRLFHNVHI